LEDRGDPVDAREAGRVGNRHVSPRTDSEIRSARQLVAWLGIRIGSSLSLKGHRQTTTNQTRNAQQQPRRLACWEYGSGAEKRKTHFSLTPPEHKPQTHTSLQSPPFRIILFSVSSLLSVTARRRLLSAETPPNSSTSRFPIVSTREQTQQFHRFSARAGSAAGSARSSRDP
jgi:hypothetical protein